MRQEVDWERIAGALRAKRAAPVESDERFVGRVMRRVRTSAERPSLWEVLLGGWKGVAVAAVTASLLMWWSGSQESGEPNAWPEWSVASVDLAAGPWGEGAE